MLEQIYELPNAPVYHEDIRRLQNSDPVDAESVVNPLIQKLVENTHFVRLLAQAIAEQNAADHAAIRRETIAEIADAVEAIPTPDVSGQISEHDGSADAHKAKFAAVSGEAAAAKSAAEAAKTAVEALDVYSKEESLSAAVKAQLGGVDTPSQGLAILEERATTIISFVSAMGAVENDLYDDAFSAYYTQQIMSHFDWVAAVNVLFRKNGVGTVDLVVSSNTGSARPTTAQLKEIKKYFEGICNLGMSITTVSGPTRQMINVSVSIAVKEGYDFEMVKDRVTTAIQSWFNGTRLGKPVLRAELGEVIYHIDGVENYNLKPPSSDVPIAKGIMPIIGSLSVTQMSQTNNEEMISTKKYYKSKIMENFSEVTTVGVAFGTNEKNESYLSIGFATKTGLPSDELMNQVQQYINETLNPDVPVDICAPLASPINVSIRVKPKVTAHTKTVLTSVELAIRSFFSDIRLGMSTTRAEMGDIIYHIDGVENYTINAPATDFSENAYVYPTINSLSVTEM